MSSSLNLASACRKIIKENNASIIKQKKLSDQTLNSNDLISKGNGKAKIQDFNKPNLNEKFNIICDELSNIIDDIVEVLLDYYIE